MADEVRDFQHIYEEYYPKIVGYLRRIVGDAEAEDVAQEVFVKVSRSLYGFRGESSLSTLLYRIATNVCLDMLNGAQRRARPMDLGAAGNAGMTLAAPLAETTWILPVPDNRVLASVSDPAEAAVIGSLERRTR